MEPIPLEDIVQDSTWIYLLTGAFVLSAAALVFGLMQFRRPVDSDELDGSSGRRALWTGVCIGSLAVSVVLGVWGISMAPNPDAVRSEKSAAQRAEAQVQIEESYGLKLTSAEVAELEYPTEYPEQDSEVFGSIENAELSESAIYLVWADGELQLSESEDGKHFSELRASELQSA